MARIRSIKPDSAVSLSTQGVSIEARYFFQNLWCHLDDEGRCEWLPKLILGVIFPSDDDPYTHQDLNRWLAELEAADQMLRSYTVNGVKYVDAPKWAQHQAINRPTKSRHPAFSESDEHQRMSTHGAVTEGSLNHHGAVTEGSLEEGKGKEGKGNGGGLTEGSVSDSSNLWEIFRSVPGYARGEEAVQIRHLAELAREYAWVPSERLEGLAKACRDHYSVRKHYGHGSLLPQSAAKDFRGWLERENSLRPEEPEDGTFRGLKEGQVAS